MHLSKFNGEKACFLPQFFVSKSFVCEICKDEGEYLSTHQDSYGFKKCTCQTN